MKQVAYELRERLYIKPGTLYVPLFCNEAGQNTFHLDDSNSESEETLRLLQFTTVAEQKLPQKLLDLKQHFDGLPPEENWELVFVQPYRTHYGSSLYCRVEQDQSSILLYYTRESNHPQNTEARSGCMRAERARSWKSR
ncbi:hypothetical protein Moror_12783 [Moniliophthora roreri MCA 2997]|uniref:Uncharacterized protein n=1 Tax=Moniliophthora roreri (strain MCA 2997) TaxID=1381753 RepID=V2XMS1_MONRO|nr:hypothetical protein Moror_12783 [Moniliophthora roreri MCA 2997]